MKRDKPNSDNNNPRRLPGPKSKAEGKAAKKPKLSHQRKPAEMSLEEWQRQLRRQFGREQKFKIRNLGEEPVFSEFAVTNPQSKRTYRVRIRGPQAGDNHCACADFATNTLGTCKHVEFTLAWLERRRGGQQALAAGWQAPFSEVFLHYGARREVRFRPGSGCSKELASLAGRFFPAGSLPDEAIAGFDAFLEEAGRLEDDLHCADDVLAFVAEVRDHQLRRQRLAEAFPRGIRSAAFKDLLKVPLYDYQREGALFAARAGRCLIGDDMGLGKTIQALAAAEILARHGAVSRVLIICPTSLKHQWQREIARFSDRPVRVVSGLRPRRETHFQADAFFKITNYDTVHRDLDLISAWGPELVILDEAQRIKNWQTRTARSVKQIQSPHALVLTGTPLENRLEELVSIVQFVDPFRLGPTFRLLHEHQVRDEVGKVVGYRDLDRIGQTLAPVLLRRLKDQVLDQLPERIDSRIFVGMTPRQRKMHDENMEIVARIVHKWRQYGFLTEADKQRLMAALQRMRMSCDSTYLLDHTTDQGPKADETMTLMDELLETQGTKVVAFSQWLRMHELLVRRLKQRRLGHVFFHGGLSSNRRRELLDRFRDDVDCRVFLSTDAGGTGLNLQHASVVINLDQPWNPAVLEQRIGRVHRLGQSRAVRVVNFIAQGTIEEGMLSVLAFKKSVFAGVLDGGDKDVFLGGPRLKQFMETVDKVTASIPAPTEEAVDEAPARAPDGRPRPARRPARRPAPEPASEPAAPASEVWTNLLQAGMAVLQQVVQASAPGPAGQAAAGPSLLARDERTGQSYLRLPVPPPDVLQQVLESVSSLLEGLRR